MKAQDTYEERDNEQAVLVATVKVYPFGSEICLRRYMDAKT